MKGEYYVYKCYRAGCTTYYPIQTVVGVNCSCWACNNDLTFTERNLLQVKAKCKKCTGVGERDEDKEKVEIASESILKQLGLK